MSSGYEIRDDLAFRQLDDTMVIVDPQGGVLHTLNAVGCFIWDQLSKGAVQRDELVSRIVKEFEVEPAQARGDLETFFAELVAKDLLRFAEPAEE